MLSFMPARVHRYSCISVRQMISRVFLVERGEPTADIYHFSDDLTYGMEKTSESEDFRVETECDGNERLLVKICRLSDSVSVLYVRRLRVCSQISLFDWKLSRSSF